MLVRNAYSGALHEVPDQQLYEVGEPVFDGFGNPVGGIFDDIFKTVKNVVTAPVQAVTSMLNPMNLLSNIIPGMGQQAPAPAAPAQAMMPWAGGYPRMQAPGPHFRPPFPAGWQHAPLPYTGLGPKRLYMRCAVWPGPSGLVPGYAANMTPQQQAAMAPAPGAGGGYGRRHHGGHRRRR